MLGMKVDGQETKIAFRLNDDQDPDKFYGKRMISGMKCMIMANNCNGIIKGHVSLF
jgi:hypothetical protein